MRRPPLTPLLVAATVTIIAGTALVGTGATGGAAASSPAVLRVGTWHGIPGPYASIDSALAAAHPGDWILVGPGDWHEQGDRSAAQQGATRPAAVLVTTPGIHLRGMDRNRVVVDGTKPGAPACSSAPADQDYGPPNPQGRPLGRNGIVVSLVSGVYVENLTACNFLSGAGSTGNEIWWNGGDGSGHVGMTTWRGNWLSATSTFFDPAHPETAAAYGLFVSNASGPGSMNDTYASNFDDASYYIGACAYCHAVIDRGHAEHSALGFSGTNSGSIVIQNSEFDDNKSGIVTNSQNNDDWPSPQIGLCEPGVTGLTGSASCEVWHNNFIHDNNDANVPAAGSAAAGPPGSGMIIAGGRFDTIVGNRVTHNGSWGILTTPYPDTETPPPAAPNCKGGVAGGTFDGQQFPCLYDDWGNEIAGNILSGNGFYGNVTNGDLADLSEQPPEQPAAPGNCWHGNTAAGGGAPTTWPVTLQTAQATCGVPVFPDPASNATLAVQVACAANFVSPCPPGASYPQPTRITMLALPPQATMPDPCAGVPADPWCPASPASSSSVSARAPSAAPARNLPATGGGAPWVPAGAALASAALVVGWTRRRMLRPAAGAR